MDLRDSGERERERDKLQSRFMYLSTNTVNTSGSIYERNSFFSLAFRVF